MLNGKLPGEEGVQRQRESRQRRAGHCAPRPLQQMFGKLAILRLPIHFDLLLRSQDKPAFLHTRGGIGAQLIEGLGNLKTV